MAEELLRFGLLLRPHSVALVDRCPQPSALLQMVKIYAGRLAA